MTRIIITLLFCLCCSAGFAQSGLFVDQVFRGKVIPQEEMAVVKVKGRTLSRYNLTFYHSVSYANYRGASYLDPNILFEQDRQHAIDTYEYRNNGLHTRIYQLESADGVSRFLCFITRPKHTDKRHTLLYMEGNVASISQLKEIINKTNDRK